MKTLAALVVLILFVSLVPSAAAAKPRLGFGVAVATESYFSTTLAEVTVESVQAGSPSDKAGLRVGDLIVELNGRTIKGASGLVIKRVLSDVNYGDHVLLKVQRTGREFLMIDITAGR
jgi:S1-C subfamily serine protease